MEPKSVTYKILSVGRKWLQAEVPEKGWKANIEINNISENFKPGDTYTFDANVEHKVSGKFRKVYVYPATNEQKKSMKDEKVKSELHRWLGYVEEKAETGYKYEKGIAKLQEIGISSHPDLNGRLNQAIKKASINRSIEDAKRALGWVEDKLPNYWYRNGEDKVLLAVNTLRGKGLEAEADKYKERLDALKNQYEGALKKRDDKAQQEEHEAGIYIVSCGEGYGGNPYKDGETFRDKKTNEVVTVISNKQTYFREDGLSFGVGDDSGYIYSAKVRPATEQEKKVFEEKESQEKEYARKVTDAKAAIQKHRDYIKSSGERPVDDNNPDKEGYRLADTHNIYGGGDWFTVTPTHIWYIRNNGADGDNWALNNVRTGGAGAIGWRIPYNKDIETDLINTTKLLVDYTKYTCDPVRAFKNKDKEEVEKARSKPKNIEIIQPTEPTEDRGSVVKVVDDKPTKEKRIVKVVQKDHSKAAGKPKITVTRVDIEEIQAKRSERARKTDAARSNKNTRTFDNAGPWMRHPDRYDLKGVDTPKKKIVKGKAPGPRIKKNGTISRNRGGRRVPGVVSR